MSLGADRLLSMALSLELELRTLHALGQELGPERVPRGQLAYHVERCRSELAQVTALLLQIEND